MALRQFFLKSTASKPQSNDTSSEPEVSSTCIAVETASKKRDRPANDNTGGSVSKIARFAQKPPSQRFPSPNHADPSSLPQQQLPTRKLTFQSAWYNSFPWLHFSPDVQGILCFFCRNAHFDNALHLDSKKEAAFITDGFLNWKKAIERFKKHEATDCHRSAISHASNQLKPPVSSKLNQSALKEQRKAQKSLMKLFSSTSFLLRQGIAFRGREDSDGNFRQLLNLLSGTDAEFASYLARTTTFTSHECIEEIASDLGLAVVRNILAEVQASGGQFSVICDGTLDVRQKEQMSICLRYVDKTLTVHEQFVGLYELADTTGAGIASAIIDAIIRFGLDGRKLRGQTYDGASNMAGAYNGCQAIISQKFPLSLHFTCASHSSNLIVQDICQSDPIITDALECLNELGKLYKLSGKFCRIFDQIAALKSDCPSRARIRPLCPTRWLCRRPAINSALQDYQTVIDSLYEMSKSSNSKTATKARGLFEKFTSAKLALGLLIANVVTAPLEELNRVAQAERQTVSGIADVTKVVGTSLEALRSDSTFEEIMLKVDSMVSLHELEPLQLPRIRQPPARYRGTAPAYHSENLSEYYRVKYFAVVDTAITQLRQRFSEKNTAGLIVYKQLECILLNSDLVKTNTSLLAQYPEIDVHKLSVQLPMFIDQFAPKCLHDAKMALRSASPEVRLLFTAVEQLVRVLLVCPVSSCEAERSFCALRRLKTWLRSTMKQSRLNHAALCHCHQDIMNSLNLRALAKEFAQRSEIRKNVFGHFDI